MVKFRHLAGEWFAAHGKGDGESGTMARDGVMQDLENDADIHPEVTRVEQRRGADTSSDAQAAIE
jgi:hypothetical protein